jgi:RNA recognition motif-containing protein
MSIRLYVGNLPRELDRQELEAVFTEFDDTVSTKVITDRKTGKCRGFGFVTVKTDEQADQLIEKFNGYLFKETPLKIEKALPRNKGKEEDGVPETSTDAPVPVSGSNNGGGGSSRRKGGGNKSSKQRSSTSSTTNDSQAVQPDPRWAQELEKLKELLAAQAANS